VGAYIFRRVLLAIPTLWGVMTLVFISIHLIPGNPAEAMLYGKASPQAIAELSHRMGLDQPLPVQYWNFMTHAIHLDFGSSISNQIPVFQEINDRFPTTLELAAAGMFFALLVAIPLGVLSAMKERSAMGKGSALISILGISIPEFWLGPMLALVFGLELHWLPIAGLGDWKNFILPGLTLGTGLGSFLARIIRASLLEVMGTDFVRTAKAKGLTNRIITIRHVARNALIPVVTVVGLSVATLLGGVVIVENIFSLPGLGSLAVTAVINRDFPTIQGTTFFFAVILIAANLLVDISYVLIDSRIQYS
jgi:ABC-type dipeptide/oligopeptide/nickel transport system permease component